MKYLIVIFLLLSSIEKSKAQHSESLIADHDFATQQQQPLQYNQAQLAQMLAPIALYPDTLLTHILIASTYPLELVQAQRWLAKYDGLSPERLANKLQDEINDKKWDASVKALMPFPRVIKRLSDDLDWTQQLGDAFLTNETSVLASIQKLRAQAQQHGSLAKMANSTVSYEGNNIVIEPQQPQIIYVPYYDSRLVYGTWHWRHYPPVYWTIPGHFYNGHYSLVTSYDPYYQPFYWYSAVHIRHHFFFGAFHWHNRHIVMINHYNKSHHSRHFYGSKSYRPYNNRAKIVSNSGAKRWQHKPQHRRGVAYSNKRLNKRYNTKKHHGHWTRNNIKTRRINQFVSTKSTVGNQHKQVSKQSQRGEYNKSVLGNNSKNIHHKKYQQETRQAKHYKKKNQQVNKSTKAVSQQRAVRNTRQVTQVKKSDRNNKHNLVMARTQTKNHHKNVNQGGSHARRHRTNK